MNTKQILLTGIATLALTTSSFAVIYNGSNSNGTNGFGGAVGTGNLSITDTLTSLNFTFNRGSGSFNDVLVVYLDTQSGGFVNNSTFNDNADGGRAAISGRNGGPGTQVNLPFAADYALAIQNGFIGVFGLASGGSGSLNYLFGAGQSGNANDPSFSITMSAAQMAAIGLTAGSGQSFSFVGTYLSGSAYRSNETIGNATTVPGDGSGNAGFFNPQTFSSGLTFTLTPVPEPSTYALAGISGLAMLHLLRRRK